ncbi:MAG: hypothetical protein LBC86_07705 [Oscillospiraceae bacterium]|jgi:hypothetical protein|nr:hypothetical protein [Oscillospiraceae bacterium]
MPKTFENLAQRGVHYFLAAMPRFDAVKSKRATAKEQENAYNFIKEIYEKLYENPELLGLKIHPDDCFPDYWTPKKEKPDLKTRINSYVKSINNLIEAVYNIIYSGNADGDKITLSKEFYDVKSAMLKKLANFGIASEKAPEHLHFNFPEGTVKGLKLLALISAENSHKIREIHKHQTRAFTLFSHGVFNPEAPYTAEIFRGIFENKEAYGKLIDYFDSNGFIRVDNRESKMSVNCDIISLDYVKFYGKPEGRIKETWSSGNCSGVQITYDMTLESFTTIGVHIPFYREVLSNADKMKDPALRSFVSRHNECHVCNWCVRGKVKNPPKFITVDEKNLCTLFTFGYRFKHFYEGTWLPDEVGLLMDFIDELFADRRYIVL